MTVTEEEKGTEVWRFSSKHNPVYNDPYVSGSKDNNHSREKAYRTDITVNVISADSYLR